MQQLVRATLFALACCPAVAALADDLKLAPLEASSPRWQARFQLSSLDTGPLAGLDSTRSGSRVLSANVLGDYYLTNSGLGGVRGGLRVSGGMLLGPLSLSQSSSGLALGNHGDQSLSVGQRSVSLLSPRLDINDPSASMSYLGVGYTGHALRSGLSFSADLGLVTSTSLGGLRLGGNPTALDDVLRDMCYKPLLQLGLSYSY